MSISFEQDPLIAKETVFLEDRQLIIRSNSLGRTSEKAYWLRDIDPSVYVRRTPLWKYYISAGIAAALLIYLSRFLPPELLGHSVLSDVLIAFGIFASSWSHFKPIEIHQIRAKNGSLVAQLYATKSKRFKCEDFIQALNDRMSKREESNHPPQHNATAAPKNNDLQHFS